MNSTNEQVVSVVVEHLTEFIEDPEDAWGENRRQAKKAIARLDKGLSRLQGEGVVSSASEYSEHVVKRAANRLRVGVPTVYISSIGSSGSHLLQKVLTRAFGAVPLGELYIAKRIERVLPTLARTAQELLMESYQLLHSGAERSAWDYGIMINTAHKPKLQGYASYTARYRSILLVRDPVEIVLSRTFRKDGYREYLGMSNAPDREYLMRNINRVEQFFASALRFPYSILISYEQLISFNSEVCGQLALLFDKEHLVSNLQSELIEAVEFGKSNKFTGPRPVIPEDLVHFTERKLADVRADFVRRGLL